MARDAEERRLSVVNGLVVVNKPAGMTSHDVVDAARRLFRTKRVGHTGTLDPDATGVLVLCLGQATRLAEYLSASWKHYVTEVVFGVETTTQDASGEITAEQDATHLNEADVCAVLPAFRVTIHQIPPMVSARHH
jgi:tRNA pseudouridine55 synthase